MSGDVLLFPAADDAEVEIPLEPEAEVELELDIEPAGDEPGLNPADDLPVVGAALMEVLPADFRLPTLIKFVPNVALRLAADSAAQQALAIVVDGAEGLTQADLALTTLRTSLKGIEEHLEDPIGIANALHKRLTTVRSEWQAPGKAALETVGRRIYTEQKRLEGVAADERRKAQAEADQRARDIAHQEAEAAAKAKAPAPVVEELKRQAETVTAPPVSVPASAPPVLRGSSTVTTWKSRLIGTPGSDEANPSVEDLSVAQRQQAFELLRAILDGKAPLVAIELSWPYLNKRAKADKSALAIAGIEAFEEGSVRAKGTRSR